MNKLIFVSGIHGVGKSTLCSSLNNHVDIPTASCSDIIKANSDYIETSKFVDQADKKQMALLKGLKSFLVDSLLLDGHFCLLGRDSQIIDLDFNVFDEISPSVIINVTADSKEIYQRLVIRDGYSPSVDLIDAFQSRETIRAHEYALSRNIPIVDYISGTPVTEVLNIII